MNIRTTLIRLVPVVFAVVWLATFRSAADEPVYQNRSLSEWLRDFDAGGMNAQQSPIAADAIRHIGSNAVPYLVERLSEAHDKAFQLEIKKWQEQRQTNNLDLSRPPSPRGEALAALDALGAEGAAALPALRKLLAENPPDPQVLYVVARMGPAGAPLLNSCLTSTNNFLQMEAKVCFDLIHSHSEVLYPQIPVGPDAPCFNRRICEFNLKMAHAAFKKYRAEHSDQFSPDQNVDSPPPPAVPK